MENIILKKINVNEKWKMKKNKRRRRKVTVKRKTKNRNWEITFVDMRVHFASVVFLFVLRYFCISLVIELSSWTFLIISVNNSSCVLSVGLCWRMYNISFQHNLLSLSAESKISTLLKSISWPSSLLCVYTWDCLSVNWCSFILILQLRVVLPM